MGEIVVLSSKGIAALPHLMHEFGPVLALLTFFALMPLGHLTIGVLLVITGLFWPKLPAEQEKHDLKIGSDTAKVEIKGSPRTALAGIGALVIFLSFAELTVR